MVGIGRASESDDWKAAAQRLRRELECTQGEVDCERERRELLQYRVHELTRQLEEERVERRRCSAAAACGVGGAHAAHAAAQSPALYTPMSHSPHTPRTAGSRYHAPTPAAAPALSPTQHLRHEPVDPQKSAWCNFVTAAKRFGLSEKDLVLVSGETLRQLIQHCGLGANPVEVARIELGWRQRQMALEEAPQETGMLVAPEAVHNPPAPLPAPPLEGAAEVYRQACLGLGSSPLPAYGTPRLPPQGGASHGQRGPSPPQPSEAQEGTDFAVPSVPMRASLSSRRSLLQRSPSSANPNAMKVEAMSPRGLRRSHSPETGVLPPYRGSVRSRSSGKLTGITHSGSVSRLVLSDQPGVAPVSPSSGRGRNTPDLRGGGVTTLVAPSGEERSSVRHRGVRRVEGHTSAARSQSAGRAGKRMFQVKPTSPM